MFEYVSLSISTVLVPVLMDLGCPLLRGSSDRRLRRCAATLPPLLEKTFPGSISFSAFEAAAAG